MKQLTKNQLSPRQQYILKIIEKGSDEKPANNKTILNELKKEFGKIARITIVRDLNELLKRKYIQRKGQGRNTIYELKIHPLLKNIDPEEYFQTEPDKRIINLQRINFSARLSAEKKSWGDIFFPKEKKKLENLTRDYQKHIKKYENAKTKTLLKKELERITIEFSWKSSQIEGNTYSLLDTERLIKEHQEAAGKKHEEAIMILNHKKALEYIWKYPDHFKNISLRKIEEIHTLTIKNLNVQTGLRKKPVGIIGTAYRPYDNYYQIREAIEYLCKLLNAIKNPFSKAVIAIAGLSYIQPFEDGNKRTSRLLGNAILLANKCCPLSYRSIDEIEYKKAIILFYEQHSLEYFKQLFSDQYQFAVKNYFL